MASNASAAWQNVAGAAGVQIVAALLGGFADTHAAAVGVALVVVSGKLTASGALIGSLAAFSANTASKIVFAYVGGGARFATPVALGLLVVLALAWLGALLPTV